MTQVTTEKAPFKDPKPAPERIVQLAQRVLTGDILLPRFQRGFVWHRKQMLDLLDSVARNYPIGSMLLWQSRQELANERNIAELPIGQSKPDYPVNYLLDGQQRLSTICGAFHWRPGDPQSVWNIAYDLKTQKFLHLDTADEPSLHVLPLRYLANPSSYFSRLTGLDDELTARARALFDRFTDYQVAIVTLGDMSIQDVAPVFERINSTGTPLTIVDLMRAATWSPTFDLVDSIDSVLSELEPKDFHGIDRKTLLRSVAAAADLGFESSAIDDLRNRSEAELLHDVEEAKQGAKRASDFLATQIGAPSAKALPYANQFAVLTEIFRSIPHPTSEQYAEIRRWFWRTTFGSYFGGWNTGQMNADRLAVLAFAEGITQTIQNAAVIPSQTIWSVKEFRSNSAISKMLALMLGHHEPVDLMTGQRIDVARALAWSNDKEFHHFFPREYLFKNDRSPGRPNAIANIIMLTSISNIQIRDKAPSEYLSSIAAYVGEPELLRRLRTCLIPEDAYLAALDDDYEGFLDARSSYLQELAEQIAGVGHDREVSPTNTGSSAFDDSDSDTSE